MIRHLSMLVVAAAVLTGSAHAQSVLVLRVKSQKPAAAGTVVVTLASGVEVTLPAADIDEGLSQAVESAMASQADQQRVQAAADPPADAAAAGAIRTKCAGEWPDDFAMRAYCEKQQQEALVKLRGRTMNAGDYRTIRNKCAGEWADDFQMRNYCEEQQLKALAAIKR